jgi:hypothetical protein
VQLNALSFFEHANSYTLWMDAADKSGAGSYRVTQQQQSRHNTVHPQH